MSDLSFVLFDFGGCLDSDGLHSRTIFFQQFLSYGLITENEWSFFQEAYSYSDKKVVGESLVSESSLLEMNEMMSLFICKKLKRGTDQDIKHIGKLITAFQSNFLIRNKVILEELSKGFKLGVISNFSGNLEVILKEFDLFHFFDFVLDSFHIGFSKPDERIFLEAIKCSGVKSVDICFCGDNPVRDIIPAQKLGMKTILIESDPKEIRIQTTSCSADASVNSFLEIPKAIQSI